MIEAVVLAGGFGTRLQTVVSNVPKPVAPVAGRTFLEIVLHNLVQQGVTSAVLSLGYLADVVMRHFGRQFEGIELVYEIEPQPRGTGGALRTALKHCNTPVALVVNGDTFLDLDVHALQLQWQAWGRPMVVGREMDDVSRYGSLLLDGRRVVGFTEKGGGGPGVINTGHYLVPTDIFRGFAKPDPFSFETDFLMPNMGRLGFEIFRTDGLFIDIGVPEDYLRAQTLFADKAP